MLWPLFSYSIPSNNDWDSFKKQISFNTDKTCTYMYKLKLDLALKLHIYWIKKYIVYVADFVTHMFQQKSEKMFCRTKYEIQNEIL